MLVVNVAVQLLFELLAAEQPPSRWRLFIPCRPPLLHHHGINGLVHSLADHHLPGGAGLGRAHLFVHLAANRDAVSQVRVAAHVKSAPCLLRRLFSHGPLLLNVAILELGKPSGPQPPDCLLLPSPTLFGKRPVQGSPRTAG